MRYLLSIIIFIVVVEAQVYGREEYQPIALNISLANGSQIEQQTESQLRRILEEYQPQITDWVYTREIIIDENTGIPHSHPTLTLNTTFLEDDMGLLATFVHEQFHWLEEERSNAREEAIGELKLTFLNVPVGGGQGARNEYSTYLHLVVCDLEYQAMERLIGKSLATKMLQTKNYYQWIYHTVIFDERVRAINIKHGFNLG